jgi:hypothetical protein
MSRSGYSDDIDDQWAHIRWRGAVSSALRGAKGQSFLKELDGALDALPEKKLVANELEGDGCFCALGAVGKARGIDLAKIDTYDHESLSKTFGIAPAMAQEIMWINDDEAATWRGEDQDAQRWQEVKNWIKKEIK